MKTLLAIAFAAISATAFAQPAVLRAVAPEPLAPLGSFRSSATIEVTIDRRGLASQPDPYTIRMEYVKSTVLQLPRDGADFAQRRCAVHGEVMTIAIVPIRYGLPMNLSGSRLRETRRFSHDRERDFPNAYDHVGGGCLVSAETDAEVFICARCLAARAAWLRRHPHYEE